MNFKQQSIIGHQIILTSVFFLYSNLYRKNAIGENIIYGQMNLGSLSWNEINPLIDVLIICGYPEHDFADLAVDDERKYGIFQLILRNDLQVEMNFVCIYSVRENEINILFTLTAFFLFFIRLRRVFTTIKLRFKICQIQTLAVQFLISLRDFQRTTVNFEVSVMNQNRSIAEPLNGIHRMRDQDNRFLFSTKLGEICIALALESLISHCKNLIQQKYVGLRPDRHGEGKTNKHAA